MGSSLPNPTTEQLAAIDKVISRVGSQPVISLTGPAGTGKTTILRALSSCLTDAEVVTPTNRAAAVLRKKGVPAATAYAVFFCVQEERDHFSGKKRLSFIPCHELPGLPEGKRDHANVIIVDEASMLNSWVISHLQRMCNTLILVGDGAQLPPVMDRKAPRGLFCSRKHDAELKTVMRQGGESDILKLATAVRGCRTPTRLPVDMTIFEPELGFMELMRAVQPQLVAFRNATRRSANLRARQALGFVSCGLPEPGDLMVCNTNWSDVLLNGTQCHLREFVWNGKDRFAKAVLSLHADEGGPQLVERFDMLAFLKDLPSGIAAPYLAELDRGKGSSEEDEAGCSFSFGYCLTAHKAQGGEWPAVVVLDERSTAYWVAEKDYEGHPEQLEPNDFTRRWFYTAVTRAQEVLYVVNPRWVNG